MDLEFEYNNRARVPDHAAIIAGWRHEAAHFRAAAGGELDLAYGDHERHRVDVFRSKDDQGGSLAVFLHGGYWQTFDKSTFSHMALGLEYHGFPMAVPSYRICPEVAVPAIIDDLRRCCLYLWERYGRHLVVAGHSAGGHLAAAMIATDWKGLGGPDRLVIGGLGVSGIYDLRPLLPTSVNHALKLDEPTARCASPLLWATPQGLTFEAWVGANESEEYRRQSRTLVAAWLGGGAQARYHEVPGANHFTVVAQLAQPDSPMTRALAALCGEP